MKMQTIEQSTVLPRLAGRTSAPQQSQHKLVGVFRNVLWILFDSRWPCARAFIFRMIVAFALHSSTARPLHTCEALCLSLQTPKPSCGPTLFMCLWGHVVLDFCSAKHELSSILFYFETRHSDGFKGFLSGASVPFQVSRNTHTRHRAQWRTLRTIEDAAPHIGGFAWGFIQEWGGTFAEYPYGPKLPGTQHPHIITNTPCPVPIPRTVNCTFNIYVLRQCGTCLKKRAQLSNCGSLLGLSTWLPMARPKLLMSNPYWPMRTPRNRSLPAT